MAIDSILVVRAGALGDTLMATPVIPALAERYPGAAIDFLSSAGAAPLLEGAAGLRRVFALRHRNLPFWLSLEKRALVRQIRAERYDLAVVLEHADRYYELAARGRVARIAGFRETPFDPALHSIANNLRAAGFDDYASRPWQMLMTPLAGESARIKALRCEHHGPVVGIHAGYGPAGRKKHQEQRLRGWSAANFAAVGRALLDKGAALVLTGAPEDRPTVARIEALLPRERVFNLAGALTLRESVGLIRNLDVLLSVDSGPAHIAAALGTPLVVLWGPGILEQTRPVSATGPVEIVREAVPCAPCYGTPLMKTCRRNICMEAITPARAVAAIDRLLTARPSLRPPA